MSWKKLEDLVFCRELTPPGPKPQNRRLCRRHVLEGEHLFMTHALPNTSVEASPKPDGAYAIVFACTFVSSGCNIFVGCVGPGRPGWRGTSRAQCARLRFLNVAWAGDEGGVEARDGPGWGNVVQCCTALGAGQRAALEKICEPHC